MQFRYFHLKSFQNSLMSNVHWKVPSTRINTQCNIMNANDNERPRHVISYSLPPNNTVMVVRVIPLVHSRRLRQALTFPVNIRAVTLTNFTFLWGLYNGCHFLVLYQPFQRSSFVIVSLLCYMIEIKERYRLIQYSLPPGIHVFLDKKWPILNKGGFRGC